MTQAFNLSQLANNLNTAGQLDATDGLVNAVPVANGGTGATTASAARTNLGLTIGTNVPSPTGTGASGTWGINITGNAATATTASTATNATTVTNGVYTTGNQTIGGTKTFSNGITFADTTTQTTAAVTPSTAFDGVGSYVLAVYSATATALTPNRLSTLANGTTVSGSLLRVSGFGTQNNAALGAGVFLSNLISGISSTSTTCPLVNTTGLSGTWRLVGGTCWNQCVASCCIIYTWNPLMWVRIA